MEENEVETKPVVVDAKSALSSTVGGGVFVLAAMVSCKLITLSNYHGIQLRKTALLYLPRMDSNHDKVIQSFFCHSGSAPLMPENSGSVGKGDEISGAI